MKSSPRPSFRGAQIITYTGRPVYKAERLPGTRKLRLRGPVRAAKRHIKPKRIVIFAAPF